MPNNGKPKDAVTAPGLRRVFDRLGSWLAGVLTLLAIIVLVRQLRSPDLPALPMGDEPVVVENWTKYQPVGVANKASAVSIVVFADFLCPACAKADSVLRAFEVDHEDEVAVAYRHYPFLSQASTEAAVFAVCARSYAPIHAINERLYRLADSLRDVDWSQVALAAGASPNAWPRIRECVVDGDGAKVVEEDLEVARELGLSGTPSVLLDSLLFHGSPGRRYLEAYVSHAPREDEDRDGSK